jgi:hypothetical protein
MELNTFYYYGVLTPYSEITSHMVQLNKNDMYSFVSENGLQYRKCGLISTTYRIVVGKEILFNPKSFSELNEKNTFMILNKDTIKKEELPLLSSAEEQKVRESLLKIGVYFEPKYYVFVNWGM